MNPDPGASGFFLFCVPLAFFIRSSTERMLERHLQSWVSFLKTEGMETQNDPFPQGLSNHSLFLDHSHLRGERTEPGNILSTHVGVLPQKESCIDWPLPVTPSLFNPII